MIKLIKRNQKGITLVELLITLTIMGVIMVPLSMTAHQLIRGTRAVYDRVIVSSAVENAGNWINIDTQMVMPGTGYIITGDDTSTISRYEFLRLKWIRGQDIHLVVYYFDSAGGTQDLHRQYLFNSLVQSDITVARHIDSDVTTCSYVDVLVTVSITAVSGEEVETKIFTNLPRSG